MYYKSVLIDVFSLQEVITWNPAWRSTNVSVGLLPCVVLCCNLFFLAVIMFRLLGACLGKLILLMCCGWVLILLFFCLFSSYIVFRISLKHGGYIILFVPICSVHVVEGDERDDEERPGILPSDFFFHNGKNNCI